MYEREIVIENYKNQTDEEGLHSLLYVFLGKIFGY